MMLHPDMKFLCFKGQREHLKSLAVSWGYNNPCYVKDREIGYRYAVQTNQVTVKMSLKQQKNTGMNTIRSQIICRYISNNFIIVMHQNFLVTYIIEQMY